MQLKQSNFKSSPKRFHPRGITILYEDRDILVVDKSCGLLTVATEKIREHTAYYLLNEYVKKGNHKSRSRVYIVHRLDRDTSGVLVFAKSEGAQHYLQEEWQGFTKIYYAVVHGILPEKEGIITSYLTENSVHRMYSVEDPEMGKFAKTEYKVLREANNFSLLEIHLHTGRKNQIRVHFSEKGFPVAGDKTYGGREKGIKRLALHAASLTISHPHSKEKMTFTSKRPFYFKLLMSTSKN